MHISPGQGSAYPHRNTQTQMFVPCKYGKCSRADMPTDWQPILGRFVAVDGIGRPIQLAAVDTETRCGQTFGWTDLSAKISICFLVMFCHGCIFIVYWLAASGIFRICNSLCLCIGDKTSQLVPPASATREAKKGRDKKGKWRGPDTSRTLQQPRTCCQNVSLVHCFFSLPPKKCVFQWLRLRFLITGSYRYCVVPGHHVRIGYIHQLICQLSCWHSNLERFYQWGLHVIFFIFF